MLKSMSILVALAAVVSAGPAFARQSDGGGSPATGRAVALNVCSACHLVAADQEVEPMASLMAPAFSTIANRPGATAAGLRTFIVKTHPTSDSPYQMPNPQLLDDQVRDVVSYILTLRNGR